MKTKKYLLTFLALFTCIIVFTVPFIFSNSKDTLLSILSTAFTALGAVATLFTLIIALALYQKFGIESKFIEKQTEKILELVDLVKGRVIRIETNKFTRLLRFNIEYKTYKEENFYVEMKSKTIIIIPEDYEEFAKPFLDIRRSYWLPNVIKEKMTFLEYYGYECEIENPKDESYARVKFGSQKKENYVLPYPKMTVEEYINKKNELAKSIEDWLSKHSDIKIDLKLDESNQSSE